MHVDMRHHIRTSESFLQVTCRHTDESFWRAQYLLRNITFLVLLALSLTVLRALLRLPLLGHLSLLRYLSLLRDRISQQGAIRHHDARQQAKSLPLVNAKPSVAHLVVQGFDCHALH